jgi:hypothetical protein
VKNQGFFSLKILRDQYSGLGHSLESKRQVATSGILSKKGERKHSTMLRVCFRFYTHHIPHLGIFFLSYIPGDIKSISICSLAQGKTL